MYNLIANFKKETFTLYHDLKIEKENITAQEIPFIKHNTHIRHLQAFKDLFNYWFLKNGFRPLMLEEDEKQKMTYKIISSETETYYFAYCIDNENTIFYLKNIDAEFQKLPNETPYKDILAMQQEAEKLGFEGITTGGAVRHFWKKNYNGWFLTKYKYNTENINEHDYNIIYKSLKGGLNILNENYKNKMLYNTYTIDINSLYPYIALNQCLPYDAPVYIDYLDKEQMKTAEKIHFKYKRCIYKIDIENCEIKENKHCWYAVRDYKKNKTIYPKRIREIAYIWDFEFERLKKDYNLTKYTILGALCFKVRKGSFDDLLNYLKNLKENSEKGTTTNKLAKQYLNSFLGKFATKKMRYYDTYKLDENENVVTSTREAQIDNTYYLPLFSFITAHGRVFMASYINDIIEYGNFIYCDTDSITCYNCAGLKSIEIDKNKFGFFKIESVNVKAVFKKNKWYCKETTDGEIKGVCAGINNEYFSLTCDEFYKGKAIYIKKIICGDKSADFPQEKYFKIYI